MKRALTLFYVATLFTLCGIGQTAAGQCPKIEISGNYSIMDGDVTSFSVSINGGDVRFSPKFDWTISDGKLKAGQGTSVIRVDTAGTGGQTITATVEVGGLPASCSRTSSISADIDRKPEATKVDEYGNVNDEDEMARLDNFALQLASNPNDQACVVVYAGKYGKSGDSKVAIGRIRSYLVKTRGVDSSRIVTMDGGKKENPTRELWLVPSGATPPGQVPDKKKAVEKE